MRINIESDNMITILLPITINTYNTIGIKQTNVKSRIQTYKNSLIQWGNLNLSYNIYIIENSNYINPFKHILKSNMKYIQISGRQDVKKGKGYGEANSELYFIKNIIKKSDTYIVKFTGRWAPVDKSIFDQIEKTIKLNNILGITKFSLNNNIALSDIKLENLTRWYVIKSSIYELFLNKCIQECDDRKGKIGWYEYIFFSYFKNKGLYHFNNMEIEVIPNPDGTKNIIRQYI